MRQLWKMLCRLFGKKIDEHELQLNNELQALRLDLDEKMQDISVLRSEISRQRGEVGRVRDRDQDRILGNLFTKIAVPISQLATQFYLVEGGRQLEARHVLRILMVMFRVFEKEFGMELVGSPGRRVSFDSDRHVALRSEEILKPGQVVIVRMPGVSFRGRVLQRADVESDIQVRS